MNESTKKDTWCFFSSANKVKTSSNDMNGSSSLSQSSINCQFIKHERRIQTVSTQLQLASQTVYHLSS